MSLFVCVCRIVFNPEPSENSRSLTFYLTETSLQNTRKDESCLGDVLQAWIGYQECDICLLIIDVAAEPRTEMGMALALLTCFGSHK